MLKHLPGSIMVRPNAIIVIVVGILVTFVTIAAGVILMAPVNEPTGVHPSSQELINNFHAHRPEFDHLLQMALKDQALSRVAFDFTRPKNPETLGITSERLKEYRTLFGELNLAAGIERGQDSVWFIASAHGLSISGSGKGYLYTPAPLDLVVDDLDSYVSIEGGSFTAYQQIEENWYVYYDYED